LHGVRDLLASLGHRTELLTELFKQLAGALFGRDLGSPRGLPSSPREDDAVESTRLGSLDVFSGGRSGFEVNVDRAFNSPNDVGIDGGVGLTLSAANGFGWGLGLLLDDCWTAMAAWEEAIRSN
jgi:hypothetical protein